MPCLNKTITLCRNSFPRNIRLSSDLNDLGLLLDSKVPILVIESFEEPRVLEMITRLAVKRALVLYTWSVTEGPKGLGFGSDRTQDDDSSHEPETILRIMKEGIGPHWAQGSTVSTN